MSLALDRRDVPVVGPNSGLGVDLDLHPVDGGGESDDVGRLLDGGFRSGGSIHGSRLGLDFGITGPKTAVPSSSDSSSIGQPDGDSDDDEEEVQSSLSLSSLDDSLPIKRGLSGYFAGRSKSFSNLSEVKDVKELGKVESPFNKRRRSLLSHKRTFCKRMKNISSFYGHGNPISMPLLPVDEDNDDGDYDEDHEHHQESSDDRPSCFSPVNQRYPDFQREYNYNCDAYREYKQQVEEAPHDHEEEQEKASVAADSDMREKATNHVTINNPIY